jgi:hypothetical protein
MPERTGKPDIATELAGLKSITSTFSVLHDIQIAQLKVWAQCSNPYFNDFEIRVDLEKREIDYDVKDEVVVNRKLKDKLRLMSNTIRWMLGDDVKVRYNLENGIDESPRNTRRNPKTAKPKRKRRSTKLARKRQR